MAAARLSRNCSSTRARPLRITVVGAEPALRLQSRAAVVAAGRRGRHGRHRAEAGAGARARHHLLTGRKPSTAIDRGKARASPAKRRDARLRPARARDGLRSDPAAVPGATCRVCSPSGSSPTSAHSRARAEGARAVVIGGGLLGIEAAYGLASAGVKVSLVHLMDRLMERQLDAEAGALLTRRSSRRAASAFVCEAQTAASSATAAGRGRRTGGRTHLPAGLVIMAVGIRPNATLARERRPRRSAAASSSTIA